MALLGKRSDKKGSGKRAWIVACLAAATLAVNAPGSGLAAEPASLEYAIKANYLYKFAPFVEWPEQAFGGSAAAFTICVSGEDPFGVILDSAIKGQVVQGRPIAVRRMTTVTQDAGSLCQVLYLGRSRGQPIAEALKTLRGAPVLTVTDDRVGPAGGVVHFVLREGRVRFAINASAAQAGGLVLSSKLLSLSVGEGR